MNTPADSATDSARSSARQWPWFVLLGAACTVPWLWSVWQDYQAPTRTLRRIRHIERIVRQGGAAVPQLIEDLSDDEPDIREDAVIALGRIGGPAQAAVPSLVRALHDPSVMIREGAAVALGCIKQPTDVTIPALVQAFEDAEPAVRWAASAALIDIGPTAVPRVLEELAHPKAEARLIAAETLERMGELNEPILRALHSLLNDPAPAVRTYAFELFSRIDRVRFDEAARELRLANLPTAELAAARLVRSAEDRARAIPLLVESLDRAEIREPVLSALMLTGEDARPAIPRLQDLLRETEPSSEARLAILEVLTTIGAERALLVPELTAFVRSLNGDVGRAASILRQADPAAAREVVSELLARLKSADPETARAILLALGGFGTEAATTVPVLINLLSGPDPNLSNLAAETLGDIGAAAADAVPALVRVLEYGGGSEMIDSLGKIGPASAVALPSLIRIAEGFPEGEYLRDDAIEALGRIGVATPAVLNVVVAGSRDERADVRLAALTAMVALRPDQAVWMNVLLRCARDPHSYVRVRVAWSVPRADLPTDFSVQLLTRQLDDPDPLVVTMAATALGELGPAAAPAVPKLQSLLTRPHNAMPNNRRDRRTDSDLEERMTLSLGELSHLERLSVRSRVVAALRQIEPASNP